MIRAGIVPCSASGYLGIAVVSDDGGPLRFIAAHSAEVGRLVKRDVPIMSRGMLLDKVREVGPTDIQATIKIVIEVLRSHCVARATFELPAGESIVAKRATSIMWAMFSSVASAGIDVDAADGPIGGYSRHVSREEIAAIAGWPEKSYDVQRRAAALMLPRLGAMARTESSDATPERNGALVPSTDWQPGGVVWPAPVTPVKQGPRTMGIDPGSAWTGVAIGEGSVAPLRLVYGATLEFGTVVPRKGKGTRRTEHSFTDADVQSHVNAIVALAVHYEVDSVIIEKIEYGRPNEDPTGIARAQWIGGALYHAFVAMSIHVETVSVMSCRAVVAGRAKGQRGGSGTERLPAAVVAGFYNWPAQSDNHMRDAGALVLWGRAVSAEQEQPAKPANTQKKRERRPRKEYDAQYNADRSAKKKAERSNAGCECKAKHARSCPLYKVKS